MDYTSSLIQSVALEVQILIDFAITQFISVALYWHIHSVECAVRNAKEGQSPYRQGVHILMGGMRHRLCYSTCSFHVNYFMHHYTGMTVR